MSQGNASAAIGLANTNKVPGIGGFAQDTVNPGAEGPYAGINGLTYYDYNPVQETDFATSPGFTLPSDSGAASGKVARLCWTNASTLTVPADGRVSISTAGVATAASGAGLYKTIIPAATVIPAANYFWAFLI
jgi:hypothetical protein